MNYSTLHDNYIEMARTFKYGDAMACFTHAFQLHEVDKKHMHCNGNKN
jgi:hypothetical protein